MSEDIVKRLREPCFFNGYDQQTSEEAADEIERLRKYEQLVNFIATDYVELSHDKVQNEYLLIIKKCRELVRKIMKYNIELDHDQTDAIVIASLKEAYRLNADPLPDEGGEKWVDVEIGRAHV